MTLKEAIEILEEDIRYKGEGSVPNIVKAEQLGIKAIERFRNLRDSGKDVGMPLLKGETEE